MFRKAIRSTAVALAAWLPFCVLSILFSLSAMHVSFREGLANSLISIGPASLLGIAVWYVCRHLPWPLTFNARFYALQILIGLAYSAIYGVAIYTIQFLRRVNLQGATSLPNLLRQLLLGCWYYAVIAGFCYAIDTRDRLHEKETLAARAEAFAATARLEALRARLHPHFLFNALHTLNALVKFKPATAEAAIERLGDMLRYALKDNNRDVVEFSEEFEFTKQYLAFEQLRYEDRLKIAISIDPESFNFDVPPFSLQTLAENAVHHAIAVRAEGGSLSITSTCNDGTLEITVRDDGAGTSNDANSHQFGLRSLRERLQATFGEAAELRLKQESSGFEARMIVPNYQDAATSPRKSEQHA